MRAPSARHQTAKQYARKYVTRIKHRNWTQLFGLVENAIYRGITADYAMREQNVECAIRARFISRSHASERLISRVFYDLAKSPCCADFINSTSYLPYSPIPLFLSLFGALASVSSVIPVTRTNFTSSARTVTSGITGCIIYSASSQTLERHCRAAAKFTMQNN